MRVFLPIVLAVISLGGFLAADAEAANCGNHLTTVKVTCTDARKFQREFAKHATYGHNPYRASYRGFTCDLARRRATVTVACKRGAQRIRWSKVQSTPHVALASTTRWRTCHNAGHHIHHLLAYNESCQRAVKFSRALATKLDAMDLSAFDFPSIKFRTYHCTVAVDEHRYYPQCVKELSTGGKRIINWTQNYN